MIGELTTLALVPLGYPIARGEMRLPPGDVFPPTYLVFQEITAPAMAHADNREINRIHLVQVNVYTQGNLNLVSAIEDAMTGAGFQYVTGRDLGEYESGHFGYSVDFNFMETKE